MSLHSAQTKIHVPVNWNYANATARLADTTPVTADIGKLAFQISDDTLWRLKSLGSPNVWTAVGGGGGTIGPQYEQDGRPTSPNAMDDEFDGSSLDPKWTFVNAGLVTAAFKNSKLLLVSPNSGVSQINGIFQPLPAGAWRFEAAYTMNAPASNVQEAGLFISDTAGKYLAFPLIYFNGLLFWPQEWSSVTTLAANLTSVPLESPKIFIAVQYNVTNIICQVSYDGYGWFTVYSASATAYLGVLGTVGLFTNAGSGDMVGVSDWFRRTI